ncbi:MAG: S-layer homology domain-containing protein [Oscillospiraceae bacterium]|nr:S-layer homology domain-containing protein [Oscillospiraceae bacterium]
MKAALPKPHPSLKGAKNAMKHIRILSLLLALALLLPAGTVRAASETESEPDAQASASAEPDAEESAGTEAVSPFFDLSSEHWAYPAVSRLIEMGVIEGYPDGSFRPDESVTLGEFTKMISAAFYPLPLPESTSRQSGPWWWQLMWASGDFSLYRDMDVYASIIGMIGTAYGEAYFYSEAGAWMDSKLTRQEMAQMMYNVMRNVGAELPDSQRRLEVMDEISDWRTLTDKYRTAISSCYVLGLLNGIDGAFQGRQGMTRAQAAVVLCRLLDTVSPELLQEKFTRKL